MVECVWCPLLFREFSKSKWRRWFGERLCTMTILFQWQNIEAQTQDGISFKFKLVCSFFVCENYKNAQVLTIQNPCHYIIWKILWAYNITLGFLSFCVEYPIYSAPPSIHLRWKTILKNTIYIKWDLPFISVCLSSSHQASSYLSCILSNRYWVDLMRLRTEANKVWIRCLHYSIFNYRIINTDKYVQKIN